MSSTYSIPKVKVGDIVRFNTDGDPYAALICWEIPDTEKDDDHWWWGGVVVGDHENKEAVWINILHWLQEPDAYDIVGHINLSKAQNKP